MADTERDAAKNIVVYRIVDKNGAALISEEAYFNADGSRDLRFNGRNRANSTWRLFLTIKEYANEEVRIIAADSPSASVNDHTLITAKWANNAFVHLTGDEEINGWKKFYRPINVYASTGLEVVRPDQDFTIVPETTTQTWFARYKDKNGKGGLLLKHYQYASGETAVVLSDINFYNADDADGDWSSLEIGHLADGTRYVRANHTPAETSNGYEVVTTRWLRSYIWNAEQSQLVHTVNAEKINGAKTFTSPLLSASSTFIKSVPWEAVSIADTSREQTANRTICEVIDKEGLRFMGLESTATTEGGRTFQVTARRRDNSGWINFLQIVEDNTGKASFRVSQSPVTESNDNSIATTAWSVGKTGNRGNLSGFETPVVQSSALTVTNTSRDTNLVTGAVKITVNDGAANQAWTKTVAISNGSATIALGSKWKWYGGAAPDVSANCVLVLHWCSTFGVASLIVTA